MTSQPQGTFLPNTKVTVGTHKVLIEKYLSEGGFAHVYLVRVPREGNKHEVAVLKRVAVPDKEHLANMRTEVETMKKLKGHQHIVTYIDSHASQLKGGGYEVFLLMEYCSGGGLIDFMNTRLQYRLTEPEILKIFGDVAEGVACMHYLKPPLLHRDLKVENVLISKSLTSGHPTYKLCDFGSTAPPRPAAKTVEEGRLIEEDVQKHTTMQYRSPEMIDIWRKQPIDEKADIWALGVLLYKLCYYTTPFEDVGQMAILNATYKYPSHPQFSPRLKQFIAIMLKEDPKNRPNIYQVLKEVCSMRGTEVPVKDIYANRTHSEVRRNESLPSPDTMSSAPIGLQKTTPQVQVQAIPDIVPQRRGRPTAPTSNTPPATKPSPSPGRGDPFTALDSKNYDVRVGAVEELSKRFPSLDEFSIVHEGGKFNFSGQSPPPADTIAANPLNKHVANALADEVFSQSRPKESVPPPKESRPAQSTKTMPTKVESAKETKHPAPIRTGVVYASKGTGTSPPDMPKKAPESSNRPIWRVPNHHRSVSQPRASDAAQAAASMLKPNQSSSKRPALLSIHRSHSQIANGPDSSMQSSEERRASHDPNETDLARASSANPRSRPTSLYLDSNIDFLRDQENSRKRTSMEIRRSSRQPSQTRDGSDEGNIENDMEYLRSNEDLELSRKRSSKDSQHRKRSSLQALSNAKNMFAGRFGDAFKRFEQNQPEDQREQDRDRVTPEPRETQTEPYLLSPITGSEATPSRHSDPDSAIDETEDLPPDVKRELERRRLSQEEKRVAEAGAEYRARMASQGGGAPAVPSKASTIQKRVQSLLDEGRQATAPRKTAEGYGRYTESPELDAGLAMKANISSPSGERPLPARKPVIETNLSNNQSPRIRQQSIISPASASLPSSASAPPRTASLPGISPRPNAPPKPKALRTGGPSQCPPRSESPDTSKPLPMRPTGLAALLAKDLEGVPDYPPSGSVQTQQIASHSNFSNNEDNLDAEFSKRYPSLNGIEMVETEIEGGGRRPMKVREI